MFQSQMKKYTLAIPQITYDEFNASIVAYVFNRDVEMAIQIESQSTYSGNDSSVVNVVLTGLTKDRNVNKGDLIDNKYLVEFVEINRLFTIVHMREINNNGRYENSN